MQIEMKTTAAGPKGNKYSGQQYTVSEEEGQALVEGGYAVKVEPEKAARVPLFKGKRGREKATASAEETATDE